MDETHQPLEGIQVHLKRKDSDFEASVRSDSSGLFQVWGVPLGRYSVSAKGEGYRSLLDKDILLEPSQSLFLEITLSRLERDGDSFLRKVTVDYTSCLLGTTLDKYQIHRSPSAHNVWSLVENQDLSSTTHRIDVGGLWGSTPALFSTRGSSSWTQNTYLLNGLDVTDPYSTGMPLFYPDFYSLRFTRLTNAGPFPQGFAPGGYFELLTEEEKSELHGQASIFFIHGRAPTSPLL